MNAHDDLLHLRAPCSLTAPATVRRALSRLSWEDWSLDDARLIATELVSNAVRHSGGGPEDQLEVRVWTEGTGLVISVRDPGHSGQWAVQDPKRITGGWGLQIVEKLAEDWGTERRDGYRVWARLARAGVTA